MSDGHAAFEARGSSGCGTEDMLEESNDTNGFSERELLDIMYNACNSHKTGEVLASTIVKYLETLTAQSAGQDRLAALRLMFDPDHQDPHVSRETFHSTMREWIAQCSQDSSDVDASHMSWPDSSKVNVNGLDLSFSESIAASSEDCQCSCGGQDLSGAVAELKHAHRERSKQNSNLLRTLAQYEDVNLQLSLEITELRANLVRAQRSAVRARSLTEELEETHLVLKEAQERVGRTQSSLTKLKQEVECLKVHIRTLEDKNEKLTFERTCAEEGLNKQRTVNIELKAELEETLITLTVRDREITKKDIVMDKMKNSHVENHKRIEGLLSEVMSLQEHSHQVLLRYDRHCIRHFDPPNYRSLQSEMLDLRQHPKVLEEKSVRSFHTYSDDVEGILHRVKRTEMAHHLHNKYPVRDSSTVEERPFPYCHQLQASIKQQLVNVLQEFELRKCVWEEQQRDWETETGSQTQIQEAKKVAVVNWCRAHIVEGAKARTKEIKSIHELSETQAELLQAQQNVSDMREQVCHLQASLRSEQECAEYKHTSTVHHIDKEKDTEREEADTAVEKVVKDQRDALLFTEPEDITASEQEQTQPQVTADGLLATLRRMEAMVSRALGTAELVRQSERRVSQVKERMESIGQRVEEDLGQGAETDVQLNALEAQNMEKTPTQPPVVSLSADLGTNATGFMDDVEPVEKDSAGRPLLSPVFPEVPELPMNGAAERGSSSEPQQEEKLLLQGLPLEQSDLNSKWSCNALSIVERPFIFPLTRSRPSLPPIMPTLPEEEEDSPEELDSSSSSPRTSTPCENRAVVVTAPTIVYPQQAIIVQQDGRPLEQARPHSPRARLARNSSGGPITRVDSTGNVIDLVKAQLPELQLSEEDRQKNLELLEQAKKVSDRFLTRRGRRSTSSLTDSPAGLSPTPTPSSSPCSSRSSSFIVVPQTAAGSSETTQVCSQSTGQHLEVPSVSEQPDLTNKDQEDQLFMNWNPAEKRKVSSGTLKPRFAVQKENCDLAVPKSPSTVNKADEASGRNANQAPATGVAKPVPRPPTQQAPCTAEIKTIGAFPPLMRAVSWDAVGSLNSRSGAPSFPPTAEDTLSDKPRDAAYKYKNLPTQPGSVQKLSKLREEHKLIRNQTIVGSKLPDLSEAAEQEKGSSPSLKSTSGEELKEKFDAMPNISDIMLRKLKLHRGLPGCAPPLTEKEVENAFVQLSLAFRNDNYTMETRIKQAERERNLTEEDTEKELEEFKGALKMTAPQWQNLEQRESYQRLIETVAVLHRLATRLSSRAETVGAVRQEKRMNKATEVMMQYVENLKRTYEKDHAELMEFKKLANQNSNRCYGGSIDTGDDGVPRPSRSMSLTLGKALPRRRVSVAVVPKFNLLNIPGQTPATAGPGPNAGPTTGAALPVLCEANDVKSSTSPEAAQPAADSGKSVTEQESEPAKPSINVEEIRAEIRAEMKAKIEEEAYNKGYQEGLKQSKAEEKCEEENDAEKLLLSRNKDEESGKRLESSRRIDEVLALLTRFCPKISISRRLLWMALMLFVVMCVVISIFTFFSDYYNRRGDT